MQKVEAVIADGQPVFVEGLKILLRDIEGVRFHIRAVFSDGGELMEYLKEHSPALLIMDLNLTTKDGFEVIRWMRHQKINTEPVVLTAYNDERMIKRAKKLKVKGYLFKTETLACISRAIKMILGDQSYFSGPEPGPGQTKDLAGETGEGIGDGFQMKFKLTKRERQIVGLIADAMSSKQIAKTLYISDQTVSVHRKNIMRKLGVSNTAALIKVAYRYGWK